MPSNCIQKLKKLMRRCSVLLFLVSLTACTHAEKLDIGRLKLAAGFHIAIFAEVPHARMLVFSPGGALLVSQTEDGKVVALVDPKHSGRPERTVSVADELNAPHQSGPAVGLGRIALTRHQRPGDCPAPGQWRGTLHADIAVCERENVCRLRLEL